MLLSEAKTKVMDHFTELVGDPFVAVEEYSGQAQEGMGFVKRFPALLVAYPELRFEQAARKRWWPVYTFDLYIFNKNSRDDRGTELAELIDDTVEHLLTDRDFIPIDSGLFYQEGMLTVYRISFEIKHRELMPS